MIIWYQIISVIVVDQAKFSKKFQFFIFISSHLVCGFEYALTLITKFTFVSPEKIWS